MTIVEKTRDEKLQYDINRAAAKIYALLSGKTDECAYLMYEKILPPQQHKIIEEAELIFSLLGKSFEKQTKATEEQGEKPVQALKSLNPKWRLLYKYINLKRNWSKICFHWVK